uniref:Uncharacterized protein n=1 Tax=Populus trichocarpa TaxID=3694 RepID=A0A2K2B7K0_POPTR
MIGVMVSCMGVMMATNRVTEISVTGRHLGLLQNLLPAMLLHGYKEGRGAMTDEKVLNKVGCCLSGACAGCGVWSSLVLQIS